MIQKRFDGSVDFNKNWADYKNGFGDLNGEFWLGNEKLHQITFKSPKYELLVSLTAFDGSVAQARYSDFSVKGEKDNYEINPGSFDTPENTVSAGKANRTDCRCRSDNRPPEIMCPPPSLWEINVG